MIWYEQTVNSVFEHLKTSKRGLEKEEHGLRLGIYGKNALEQKEGRSVLRKITQQLGDFMIIILLAAAAVSFLMSLLRGERDFADPAIILAIVTLNAVIGVAQESRAEKAIEALKKLSAPHAKVRRGGEIMVVSCEDVVPGDILILETGDYIAADARIIECTNLKTEESALTGESLPQDKHADAIGGKLHIGDQSNMLFATTLVVSGRAEAVAVETGMNTQVGRIAKMIASDENNKTPLQVRLADIGRALGTGILAICTLIFILGFMRKMPAFDMFMTSVSLAVAAIPEGLPAIVTVVLAIGVKRMSGKNAIIRKLPAVETLGSASVICSDKTGTLTQNKITVVKTACDDGNAITLAALCCNGTDPTERAILAKAGNVPNIPRVSEIPFDSKRKLMTVVCKTGSGFRIITKGAPDVLIEKCAVSDEEKKRILDQNSEMAKDALRVLGVAYRDVNAVPEDPERGLIFAGLIGTADPVRPEAKEAVKLCRRAGIKTVMITGDHIHTACAIANELGIMRTGDRAITGKELALIPDNRLEADIFGYSVFARVSPEDKLRIVRAFQKRNAIVAMTGDGVNDAPALKTADIGCAMGINGTEVAKGAADMVLADDNFSTIVEAVRQGRGIYDNIRKSVHFLLSSNIGEILTIFIAIFFGWPAPLLAIQLLWVNLVTDSLPAIALGMDEIDRDIMLCKPKSKKSGIFQDGLGLTIFLEGCIIGLVSLIAFSIGMSRFDLVTGRTMAFCVLSISQLVHSFDVRSGKSVFSTGIKRNNYLIGAFVICCIMQVAVVAVPVLSRLFKVVPLTVFQWGIVALLSIIPSVISEIQKKCINFKDMQNAD
ncbi:MAG: Calcium-transporting ATPase 1 [Firmicutes bacterium ADurb.Bin193]|nr:MAG: Calcium-transporting ATPase 1 [Firmicutes bacterium ADurb.Bin193]